MIQKTKLFQFFAITFVFWAILFPPWNNVSARNRSDVSKAELTDQQKAALILNALSRAINAPTEYNLDVLIPVIAEENTEHIRERIRSLRSKSVTSKASSSENNQKMTATFKMRSSEKTTEILSSSIKTEIDVGNLLFSDTITLNFKKKSHYLQITNINHLLDRLENLDNGFEISTLKASRTSNSNSSEPIFHSTSYISNNLLIPKPIYGGIQRLTKTSSRANFNGHDIFSNPTGIYGLSYFADETTETSEWLFITDPNWNRLIACATYPNGDPSDDKIKAFGSYGNDDFLYRHPAGFTYLEGPQNMNPLWFALADAYNNCVKVYSTNAPASAYNYEFTIDHGVDENDLFDVAIDVAAAYCNNSEIAVLDRGNERVMIYDYNGNFRLSIDGSDFYGSGLSMPTSICYAKNELTHYAMPYIYIADAGNRRVVTVSTVTVIAFRDLKYLHRNSPKMPIWHQLALMILE